MRWGYRHPRTVALRCYSPKWIPRRIARCNQLQSREPSSTRHSRPAERTGYVYFDNVSGEHPGISYCERPRRPVREGASLLWRNEPSNPFCDPFLPKFWVLIRQHGMRTHYETLGIGREASPTQIKRAYRSLAKLCHPDLFASGSVASAEAEKRMKQINMAYAVLSNPHRRETYDRNLRVKESHYSELNPEHCAKCGQLTLYWHTERKASLCEACRRVGR
jgi:DnaJ-domain-containing protein 1